MKKIYSKDIKTVIQTGIEMCVKYPWCHITFYFRNDKDNKKFEILNNVFFDVVKSKHKEIDFRICKWNKLYFNVSFKNGSRFYITSVSESVRGLRNHHCIVDSDIPKDITNLWIYHSLLGAKGYNDIFGRREDGTIISKEDENYFETMEMVTIIN